MKKLMKKDFKIVENFKWLVLVSVVIFVVAAILMCTNIYDHKGLNFGIDYKGGGKIEIELGSYANDDAFRNEFESEVTKIIKDNKFKPVDKMQVSDAGSGALYEFRLEYFLDGKKIGNSEEDQNKFMFALNGDPKDNDVNGLVGTLQTEIENLFKTNDVMKKANAELDENAVRAFTVSATASSSLIKSTILAISVAIVVILVYIIFRFTLSSGIAAIIALAHDVLFMIAFTGIFNISVNSTFIAAVITIIGYSINATIVIFDKIRECRKSTAFAYASDAEIANYAIKHSFVKIMLSTITTLVMVVALVIFSVTTIREFIYPIIFGLIGGTFSSLCLSPSIWVLLRKVGKKTTKQKKA